MSIESSGGAAVVVPQALAGLPDLHSCVPAQRGPRLTRRGRLVVLSALGLVATSGFSLLVLTTVALGASTAGASDSLMLPSAPSTVVVHDGDTLWEIAERTRPDDDPRRTVLEIVELNQLSDLALEPGQELVLPDS
ncbi:LysM peptidoglycan-binding domain-containing protein [Marinitenerispora sediminis]|uniref:LysM peptidoglycan-binding domain-containing protein n=1 Tax=Marinitenerispora sediminis TaxID=1931232 RepID=UPI001F3C77F8|nr:LysM peptidoglycan-binding domain-containing protein [Marinitenerispora sediminis]